MRVTSINIFVPRASQGRQEQFLGRPGPCQILSGTAPGRPWKQGRGPRVAQRLPGSHFEAARKLQGATFELFGDKFRTMDPL